MDREIVKLQIETLAHLLHQHLDIMESLRNTSTLLARSPSYLSSVEDELNQLAEIRRSMIESLRVLRSKGVNGEDREDLLALAGYIVEAVCRSERRLLDRLSSRMNVKHHIAELRELENEAKAVMAELSGDL